MRTVRRRELAAVFTSLAVMIPLGIVAAAPASAAVGGLVVNEVVSTNDTVGDWIELKNTGATTIDASGYLLADNSAKRFTIPAGSTIAAGGYAAFYVDVTAGFGLGNGDSARLFLADNTTLVDTMTYGAHAATSWGRCPDGTGDFVVTTLTTRGAANDCSAPVRINEIESSDGDNTDWVELRNVGATSVDITGFQLKDNGENNTKDLTGTIAAGGYLAVDVSGLGGGDTARLFAADHTTLLDSYLWTTAATTTYGRCPDGTGAFATTSAATKGAVNACAGDLVTTVWPGSANVAPADTIGTFGGNMSGLDRDGAYLWAVKNGPGTLYRLVKSGSTWVPDTAGNWGAGKVLHYADGTGDVDAEGVTITDAGAAGGIFAGTERDNNGGGTRPSIVKYTPSETGATLNATGEWPLLADLPAVGANAGIEAITWIPDSVLVAQGFYDEHTAAKYNPATYADHGTGLFVVGVEGTGDSYVYALNLAGSTYTRVATIDNPLNGVMELQFDAETSKLWWVCDDGCNDRHSTMEIAQSGPNAGKFVSTAVYERPASQAIINNEGFAIAPQSECVAGFKEVVWANDSATVAMNALSSGTIPCTVLPVVVTPPVVETPPAVVTPPATETPVTTTPAVTVKTFTKVGKVTISGTKKVGKKLKVTVGKFSPKPSLTYRWYANGKAIAKATKATFTITKSVKGKKITVKVTAKRSGYKTVVVTSKATTKIK